MKNLILTFLLFTGIVATSFGQQTQAIKIGPLGFLLGNYNLRYERAIAEKSSVQVGANFFDYELFEDDISGFGIDLGYRYYFREAIEGAYVSPAVGFDFLSAGDYKYSTINAGATVGYQWVAGGGFLVDLGLGYGYSFEVSKDEALLDDYNRGGVRFTFSIGYAF